MKPVPTERIVVGPGHLLILLLRGIWHYIKLLEWVVVLILGRAFEIGLTSFLAFVGEQETDGDELALLILSLENMSRF